MLLSIFFERHRDQYISCLRAISEEGTWKKWLLFFLEAVKVQSHQAIQSAETLRALKEKWRDELTEGRASASALTLLEHLFEQPVISIPQARSVLDLTYNAARYNVKKLGEKEILRDFSINTHPTLYYAPAILSIVMGVTERARFEGGDEVSAATTADTEEQTHAIPSED